MSPAFTETRFVVIGAGGLGGPIAHALADAGPGSLSVYDPDHIELSNLQRQIHFTTADVGQPKASVLAQRLRQRGLAADRVHAERVGLNLRTAERLLTQATVVIDASDSIACKFTVNDEACARGIPFVIASVQRYEAQVMSVVPGKSSCYRCLFEDIPDQDIGSCQTAGVFGAAVAMIAARAAHHALELALGRDARAGTLEVYDDLRRSKTPRFIAFRPRAGCPACQLTLGDQTMPTIRIPTPLRKLTDGKEEVTANGSTIGEVLTDLEKNYPGIKARICDEQGQVRRFVNIFANEEDIRFLKNLDTPVKDGDEISIVPAIAGGI